MNLQSTETLRNELNGVKAILLDLDGTVYEGNRLIKGADGFVEKMRSLGLRVFFCTNNSSSPRSAIAGKLIKMGISCDEKDVVSSGFMALRYALSNNMKNVCISGTEEFINEFRIRGINPVSESEAENLIISMDTNVDYPKITKAVRAALRSERIIVCNYDRLFPKEDGVYPGCGAIVSAVLFCSGRNAYKVLGKPGTHMMEYVSEITGYSADEMMVIGDSLESDIAMADAYGSPSVLVGRKRDGGLWAGSLKELTEWDWHRV
jgi:HAD superfamily hydrolase (TIGR01450 family)